MFFEPAYVAPSSADVALADCPSPPGSMFFDPAYVAPNGLSAAEMFAACSSEQACEDERAQLVPGEGLEPSRAVGRWRV